MKKFLLAGCILAKALLLPGTAAFAQLVNGDFESRNQAPQGSNNIGPARSPNYYDDLTDWYRPGHDGTNKPTYVALDGAPDANPTTVWNYYLTNYGMNFSFAPHSGQSCLLLSQHDMPGDHTYDHMVTQRLAAPLRPGQTYLIGFWALRSVSARYRTKLALWITDRDPVFDTATNTISPSPGNKVLESSDDLVDMTRWVYVKGSITIPKNETDNQWITIGYARTDQYEDTSLPPLISANISFINYAIDDVSLVGTDCAPNLMPVCNQIVNDPCNGLYAYQITNYNPNYTYSIRTTGFLSASPIDATNPANVNFKITGYKGGTFTVTASDRGCNGQITTTTTPTATIAMTSSNCRTAAAVAETATDANATTAYPSPASEMLSLPRQVEQATLLDNQGRPVMQLKGTGKLDVRNLPDGLYNLRMLQNGELINQHIQIKH
jgi:hypothetical protein